MPIRRLQQLIQRAKENELWDKFKAATDAFNEKKTENIDQLREEENKNLIAKQALIQRAIAAQSSESYEEGHQAMQQLMGEWKKIGSVPRKKSSKVWKQFKDGKETNTPPLPALAGAIKQAQQTVQGTTAALRRWRLFAPTAHEATLKATWKTQRG